MSSFIDDPLWLLCDVMNLPTLEMISLLFFALFFLTYTTNINGQECGLSRNAIRTTGFVQGVDTNITKVWLPTKVF